MQLSQIQVIPDVSDYDIVEPVYLNAVGNYDGVQGEIYLRGFEIDREIEGENIDIEYYVYDQNGERDEFGDPSTFKTGRAATYYDPSFDSHFIAIEDYVTLIADPEDGSMDATVQIQYANQVGAPLVTTITIPVRSDQQLPETEETTEVTHNKTIHDKQPRPAIDYGSFLVEEEVTPPSIIEEEDEPSFEEEPEQPVESTATIEDQYLGTDPSDQALDSLLDKTDDLDIKVTFTKPDEIETLSTISLDETITPPTSIPEENPVFSFFSAATIDISNRIDAVNPPESGRNLFLGYGQNFNRQEPELTRNPNFWGSGLNGITAISTWNNSESARRRKKISQGVAITPRHVIFSAHADFSIPKTGDILGFYDKDNNQVTREVLGFRKIRDENGLVRPDISMAVLESDLPSSIGFVRTMPSDIFGPIPSSQVTPNGLFANNIDYITGPQLIWGTNQTETGTVFRLTTISAGGQPPVAGKTNEAPYFRWATDISEITNPIYNTPFIINDSGSPLFTVKNNEAILMGIVKDRNLGMLTGGDTNSRLNNLINEIDLEYLDFPTNYTVTESNFDLNEPEFIVADSRYYRNLRDTEIVTEVEEEDTTVTTTETTTENPDGSIKTEIETSSGTQVTIEEKPVSSTTTTENKPDGSTETTTETTYEITTTTETSDGKTNVTQDTSTTTETITETEDGTVETVTESSKRQEDIVVETPSGKEVVAQQPHSIKETVTEYTDGSVETSTTTSDGKTETSSTRPSDDTVTQDDSRVSRRLGSREESDKTFTLTIVNESDLDLTTASEEGFKLLKSKDVIVITRRQNLFFFALTQLQNRGIESVRFDNARVDILNTRGNLVGGSLDNIAVDAAISEGFTEGTIYVYVQFEAPVDDDTTTDDTTTDDTTTDDTTDDTTPTSIGDPDDTITTDDSGQTDVTGEGGTCNPGGGSTCIPFTCTPGGSTPGGGSICIPFACTPDDGGTCIPFDPTTTTVDDPGDPNITYTPSLSFPPPDIPIIPFIPANCGKRPVVRIGVPPQEDPDNPDPEVPEEPEILEEILLFPAPVLPLEPPFLCNLPLDTNVTLAVPPPLNLEDEDEDNVEITDSIQSSVSEKINLCEEEECTTLGF